MGVRFLHLADLHLGSQVQIPQSEGSPIQEIAESAGYIAAERLFEFAINEDVDFIIIAGDLYDEDSRSVRANAFLEDQFSQLASHDIPAYIIYGNHDPVGDAPTYVDLPENVHEFNHENPEGIEYTAEGKVKGRIWGQSYRDRHESRKMYRGYTPPEDNIPNIGVLHTGLDSDGGRYVPVSKNDLQSKDNIDYWALGHEHGWKIFEDGQPLAYSGIPQGRHIREPGVGGGLLVSIEDNDSYSVELVPAGPIIWQTVDVEITDDTITTIPDLERRIESEIDDITNETLKPDTTEIKIREPNWDFDGYVIRWQLLGNAEAYNMLREDGEAIHELTKRLRDSFSKRSPYVWTESVRNQMGPPIPDIDGLIGEDRVIDQFVELKETFNESEILAEFREEVGDAWTDVDDHEEGSEDELPLTDDRLRELVKRAEDKVMDELALRRAE